jgi:hypothetical protein
MEGAEGGKRMKVKVKMMRKGRKESKRKEEMTQNTDGVQPCFLYFLQDLGASCSLSPPRAQCSQGLFSQPHDSQLTWGKITCAEHNRKRIIHLFLLCSTFI